MNWAQTEGFSRYVTAILDHDIDGRVLLSLNELDLKELGMKGLGDRKRFSRAIKLLRTADR